jgi:hypothetical protein
MYIKLSALEIMKVLITKIGYLHRRIIIPQVLQIREKVSNSNQVEYLRLMRLILLK